MKEFYELKEKLCDELKEYGKKDMSAGSLDVVDKLTHTIKNLDKIIENYEMEGYSGDMSYGYSNEGSYARGRGRNARRDSRGRYSSRGYSRGGYSSRDYSRDGYSYGEGMVDELRDLMEDAPNEETKQEFKRFIKKIESM